MKERLKYLFQNYLDKKDTREEREELFGYISESQYDAELREIIEETWNVDLVLHEQGDEEAVVLFQRILGHNGHNGATTNTTKVRRMWKWVAAAAIIIVIAAVGYLSTVGVPANDKGARPVAQSDVAAPSNTRAVITLADGSKVYLDSASSGTIAQENNVNVVKGDSGEIRYALSANGEKPTANSPSYNTLSNPRGSKVISLTLSDGTKVWLNSESSLKYPAAFTGNTREVEITGEAYFEVKHNAKQPFKVHLPNGSMVEDLGTEFNINAYPDEDAVKTTLIQGSVRVVGGDANKGRERPGVNRAVVLKPGQQAAINTFNLQLLTFNGIDLDEVTAWKNGLFQMDNADIATIMRQLSRWYDMDIVYQNGVPQGHITGKVPRNTNLSNVLKIFEYSGVKCTVEGRKIVVLK